MDYVVLIASEAEACCVGLAFDDRSIKHVVVTPAHIECRASKAESRSLKMHTVHGHCDEGARACREPAVFESTTWSVHGDFSYHSAVKKT